MPATSSHVIRPTRSYSSSRQSPMMMNEPSDTDAMLVAAAAEAITTTTNTPPITIKTRRKFMTQSTITLTSITTGAGIASLINNNDDNVANAATVESEDLTELDTSSPSSSTSSSTTITTSASTLALPAMGLGAWAWGDALFWGCT